MFYKIPDGHYAIRTADGTVKFYRISNGNGKWNRRIFVEAQASDQYYSIQDPITRTNILQIISLSPFDAMALYGQELGRCAICRRLLTDEDSRKRGIGSTCRAKLHS